VIVYAAFVKGQMNLYRKLANRSSEGQALLENNRDKLPTDWSPDGRFLLFTQSDSNEAGDLWVLPVASDGKPFPLTETHFDEQSARFSPNSQWIAYSSDESGKREIYVRRFPGPGERKQISSGGGVAPRWSQDGHHIYYQNPDWKLMEISVTTGSALQQGIPRLRFSVPVDSDYEVFADGKFLVNEQVGNLDGPQIVLLNWQTELGLKK